MKVRYPRFIVSAYKFFRRLLLKNRRDASSPGGASEITFHTLSEYAHAAPAERLSTHRLGAGESLRLFKGARVLCLVEAGADVSYIDHIARRARRMDFILQGENAKAIEAIKRHGDAGVAVSYLVDDRAFGAGTKEDVECANAAISFVVHLSENLKTLFATSTGTQFLVPYCRSMAQSIEPIVYYFCYFLPKLIDTVFSKHNHHHVVVFARDGEYWGHQMHFVSQILELDHIHIVRASKPSAHDRLLFAAKMEKIAKTCATPPHPALEIGESQTVADVKCVTDWLSGLLRAYQMRVEEEAGPEIETWRGRGPYGVMTSVESRVMSYIFSESRRSIIDKLSNHAPVMMLSMGEPPASINAYKTDVLQGLDGKQNSIEFYCKNRTSNQLAFDLVYFLDITAPVWLDPIDDQFLGRSIKGIFRSFGEQIFKDRLTDNIDMILFLNLLFDAAAPSYVLTYTGEVTVGQLALDAARARGIPTYDIQAVAIFDEPRCLGAMFPKSDILFALDRPSGDLLQQVGWREESLLINGPPRGVKLLEANHGKARAEGRKLMKAPTDDDKVICFMTQALSFDQVKETLGTLVQLCAERPRTRLLVKVHPREPAEHDEIYAMIANKSDCIDRIVITRDLSPLAATCASDVLISLYSNTIFEAAMLGIPAVAVNLSGERYPDPMNLSDFGYAAGAFSVGEIEEVVGGLLFDRAVRNRHLRDQKEFFADNPYYTDGKAIERVVSTIYSQAIKPTIQKHEMTTRFTTLGGKRICRLGFGTWPLGGEARLAGRSIGHAPISDQDALAALDRAIELGVGFFDTADIYGLGAAETLLGKALKGRRDKAVICTKFGARELDDGSLVSDFSPAWMERCVEGSLKRLRTDYLDILLMHGPADGMDWASFDPEPFDRMVACGKIGRYGVSSHSVHGAEAVLEAGFGSAVEVIYNAMDRRIEERLLPEAESSDVFVVARVPLAKGFISEKYSRGVVDFPKEDHRALISDGEKAWMLSSARKLSFLSDLPGGMAISGLRFCLSDPRIGAVIPGMRSIPQVEENVKAVALGPLSSEILRRIREAVPEVYSGWIGKQMSA